MKKNKKPVFFIVLLVILLFTVSVVCGFSTQYGDTITTHIKGLDDIRFGIDIQGGVDVTFTPADDVEATDDQLDAALEVIKLRLASQNINDSEVYTDYNNDKIVVRFPWQSGETDFNPEKAVNELGEMAVLTFREGQEDPEGAVILSGSNVTEAVGASQYDQQGNIQHVVQLKLDSEGTSAFATATTSLAASKGYISIYMDDECVSSPQVQVAITNGEAIITGSKSLEEAKTLADKINSGSLPFSLETSSFKTISPTMGQGALKAMIIGGLIAFLLIAIYMIVLYRLPGVVAVIGLIGTVAGTLAITSGYFGFMSSATLTIPGIAGIILTVGIGVDANIITAERIKEELSAGKSIDTALKSGYHRALSAIIDGNVTIVIVAIILMGAFGVPSSFFAKILNWVFFAFGVSTEGTIYSFGFTLLGGVILNLIMGVLASRLMVTSLSKLKPLRKKWLYGGVDNAEKK